VQGHLEVSRRNYAGAFAAAAHPAVLAQLRAHNESLLLVGSLNNTRVLLPIPPELAPHVRLALDLDFQVGRDAEREEAWSTHQGLALLAPTSPQRLLPLAPRLLAAPPPPLPSLQDFYDTLSRCRAILTAFSSGGWVRGAA
jgi:hypothetical protein